MGLYDYYWSSNSYFPFLIEKRNTQEWHNAMFHYAIDDYNSFIQTYENRFLIVDPTEYYYSMPIIKLPTNKRKFSPIHTFKKFNNPIKTKKLYFKFLNGDI